VSFAYLLVRKIYALYPVYISVVADLTLCIIRVQNAHTCTSIASRLIGTNSLQERFQWPTRPTMST